jgi:hypothetical protein
MMAAIWMPLDPRRGRHEGSPIRVHVPSRTPQLTIQPGFGVGTR